MKGGGGVVNCRKASGALDNSASNSSHILIGQLKIACVAGARREKGRGYREKSEGLSCALARA